MSQIAYTIENAAEVANIGKTKLYQALNSGVLEGRKVGRRTLIPHDALRRWVDSLPKYTPQTDLQDQLPNT